MTISDRARVRTRNTVRDIIARAIERAAGDLPASIITALADNGYQISRDKGRSLPQHKRYFALIRAAYHHWPENHAFKPRDENHLRKWLQCKAGHYTSQRIVVPSADPAIMTLTRLAAESALAAAGADAWVDIYDGCIVVFTPKSIAFDKLGHQAACRLFDGVSVVVEVELDISADELMRQTERAT